MENLHGKVAVVTGAASGIGFALGQRFAAEGLSVALADVEAAALDRAVAEISKTAANVIGVVTDVSQAGSVDALAREVVDRLGGVHVVCNNAGVGGEHYPTWEAPLEYWEWVLSVNLWGVIHGVRSFAPILIEQREGHLVNTASVAGLLGFPYIGAYVAAKHAVVGISEALFHELAVMGSPVKVSLLCPGAVETRFAEAARNWPSRLGAQPATSSDAGAQAVHELVRSGVRTGLAASRVAELVVDAIRTGRFLVLTEAEFGARALASFTEAIEGRAPLLPVR